MIMLLYHKILTVNVLDKFHNILGYV